MKSNQHLRGRWRIRAIRGGRWFRERSRRTISMLPHLFTLLNLTAGVFSILMTLKGQSGPAALLIGVSLLADGLDGRVARLVRADGEFGKELDSLADVVAFGVAPAVLAWATGLQQWGTWGLAVAALFPVCGALRLARFNVIKASGFFVGLPITAAGTLLAAVIFRYRDNPLLTDRLWLPAFMVLLCYLMVSTIPYPDFKKRGAGRVRPWDWVVPAGLALWALVRDPQAVILLPLAVYAFLGPYLYLLRKAGRQMARLREAGGR